MPSRSAPPPVPFETTVRSYELDALGHVNHAVYLNWYEQARYDALTAAGLTPRELLDRGWGIHVARIEVDYRAECRLGDRIHVHTAMDEVRNSSMTIRQRMERRDPDGDTVVSEARVIAVWVGTGGRPMRIPEPVRSRFESWIPDAGGAT